MTWSGTTPPVGVLIASLVGSAHCAGMCGAFVCVYAGSGPSGHQTSTDRRAIHHGHLLYNGGRLLSYLLLGALAGGIGSVVTHAGALAGIQRGAALLAGVLMVLWALSAMASHYGMRAGRASYAARVPEAWQQAVGRVLHGARQQPVTVRALLLGLLTTLLPCGWLYVFVATAGGTGSIPAAMTTMALFWLGTVPAMLAVGLGAQQLLGPIRRRLPLISAALVLTMGLLSIGVGRAPANLAADHGHHAERVE